MNAERHLTKLGKGISKKDIAQAAPYFRLFRVHKLTTREIHALNQEMKNAESLWTMAEDAVAQLKFSFNAEDLAASEACAEGRILVNPLTSILTLTPNPYLSFNPNL